MIDEYDEIAKVVALFMEGAAAADAAKLEAAFHPQARLIGTGADGAVYDDDRETFVGEYLQKPTMNEDGRYRGRLVSVEIFGSDIAVAVVAEDHCWGQEAFIDILSLWRQPGQPWKIVNKVFTQTRAAAATT